MSAPLTAHVPSRKRTSTRRIVIFLVILGLFLGTYGVLEWEYQNLVSTPMDASDATRHEFVVKEGGGASAIGSQLEQEGLIRSTLAFRILASSNGVDSKFFPGRFALRKNQSASDILKVLTEPSASERWITTLEGWRATEVADYLEKQSFVSAKEFMDCVNTCTFDYDFLKSKPADQSLEGYLFPDTYVISAQASAKDIISKMLSNFDSKLTPELRDLSLKQKRSLHDIVTMASIIEREVRTDKDRPIVAGILWKRYDNRIGLGADSTVLYALGDWRALLTAKNLAVDSPYNTRKYAGLPPGPISNPGLKSLEAAVNPEESPYLYYLTTLDTGKVIYGKTLEEHNQNVAKYLK